MTDTSEVPRADTASAPRRQDRYLETLAVFLLACAGIATSWSSYQAALWGGVQATSYSRASALRIESTRASVAADQQRAIDLAVFVAWLEAYAAEETVLREFLEQRFRPEFKPAFDAWIASRPRENPSAARTPFQLPQYRLAKDAEAERLEDDAERMFAEGVEANRRSDAYVLNAVLLASVLFFAGIAQRFDVLSRRRALVGVAALLLVVCAVNLIRLPKLW